MTEALEPADRQRCQVLRPNPKWSPFNLGPADTDAKGHKHGGSRQVDRMYRCPEKPVCTMEEAEPGPDGKRGEMSLCKDCFIRLCLQEPGRARLKEQLEGEPA